MPIQERKFFIQKHNIDAKKEHDAMNGTNDGGGNEISREYTGEALNAIAAQQQKK